MKEAPLTEMVDYVMCDNSSTHHDKPRGKDVKQLSEVTGERSKSGKY